jgi:hypothetical protein
MPEPVYRFSHKELAAVLVKETEIKEGFWGIAIEYGFAAANVKGPSDEITPASIVSVLKIGLQRFEEENDLSVDASKINITKESKLKPKAKK